MSSILKINTNDIDDSFVSKLKKDFQNKEILITEVSSLDELKISIENIDNDRNIRSFSLDEFEKYSDDIIRDKK